MKEKLEQKLKQKKQDGSALIIVVCLLCIFAALSLSMTVMAYQTLSQSQQSATKEQCRIAAITFSQILEQDITSDETNEIKTYLYNEIHGNTWPYYSQGKTGHEKEDAYRSLTTHLDSSATSKFGDMSSDMYWEMDGDYGEIVLVMIVTSEQHNQKYSVTTRYELKKPDDAGDEEWDLDTWKWVVTWQGL